jgi:hypothetical protein
MISIIICSRTPDIPVRLRDNITETIGDIPYEIIAIDNSANTYSIFTAYNKGVSLSRYPLLLFMHDDVLHRTPGWGTILSSHFRAETTGAIGVAGTPYLPWMPGGWWTTGNGYLHLLQSEPDAPAPVMKDYAPSFLPSRKAVALDGVWFVIRKSLFDHIRFDDNTYHGFHFYDIDTTLQVFLRGYDVLCVNDILIHHLSPGVLDDKWIRNIGIFRQKWIDRLPIACFNPGLQTKALMEYRVMSTFISDQLRVIEKTGKKKSDLYLAAFKDLMVFARSCPYPKIPYWGTKLLFRYLRYRLAGL